MGENSNIYFNRRLGKRPAKKDKRTLKLKKILRDIPDIPEKYDFDIAHPEASIPLPMFANDIWGNCVIAGRSHQTLRFEFTEQNRVISITDDDVIKQYFKETGGADEGLVMIDSLNSWRQEGLSVNGGNYNIYAYGKVNPKNRYLVKATIYLLSGASTGFMLPISVERQMDSGQVWDVVKGFEGEAGSFGGHCVFICGYDEEGPTCITWGQKQKMTWKFLSTYCDEFFGIVDNRNKENSNIDIYKLNSYLIKVTC